MEAFAAAVEASAIGQLARESRWVYPAANLAHLLGLVLLIGSIGLIDLRVMGWFRALPLATLSKALTPLGLAGLALMLVSGPVLFAADATALVGSTLFLIKLALIALALANAALFRFLWREHHQRIPPLLRMIALVSLLLWLSVAALGRLIAYA